MLQRWSLQGEGAASKLMRLEKRLAGMSIKAKIGGSSEGGGVSFADQEPLSEGGTSFEARAKIRHTESLHKPGGKVDVESRNLLKQRLEYRPKRAFLVNSNILRRDETKHTF